MHTYMGMYTAVHNFCTSVRMVRTATGQPRPGGLHGEELYVRLSAYLKESLSDIAEKARALPRERLLEFYNEQWSRFLWCSKLANHSFRFLNRHWVKREMDEGRKWVHSILDLHLRTWRTALLDSMHEELSAVLLDLLQQQRNGEYVEQLPRKGFMQSVSE